MTTIKVSEDPGYFSFEIINEESGNLDVLHFNVLDVIMYLSFIDGAETTERQVEAMRKCAKPKKLVDRLADYELLAKLVTATTRFKESGNVPGFSPTSPPPTALSSSQRESRTTNMSTA